MQKILFIGGGNMACAIIDGLLSNKYDPASIFVVDHNQERRNYLLQHYQINVLDKFQACIDLVQVVVLAVKPQVAKDACLELAESSLAQSVLVISVMAGITFSTLGEWFGPSLAVIRAMPNLPSAIGEGATGLYASELVSAEQKRYTELLFSNIGAISWLNKEEYLNVITALSGSGPAYYFYFMEIMQSVAIKMGLDVATAKQFAVQTAYGAAKFARDSGQEFTTLRKQVTSKNGTTEAALNIMTSNHLNDILEAAMHAALSRSLELSQSIN